MHNVNNDQILAKSNGITLKKHTEDILNCFKSLSTKLNNLINEDIKKCIEWGILLHDLGKALPYFQIVVLLLWLIQFHKNHQLIVCFS